MYKLLGKLSGFRAQIHKCIQTSPRPRTYFTTAKAPPLTHKQVGNCNSWNLLYK